MIKVLEIISDTNIGGAGRLLMNKINYSDKTRFKYTFVLPRNSLLSSQLKKAGARVIEIDGCKDRSFDLKTIIAFFKIIKNISPNILNSHACMSARIAGRLALVDVNLYTRHCDFPIKKIYSVFPIKSLIGIVDNCLSDGIIAVSQSAKRNLVLRGTSSKKIKVIINGAKALKLLSDEDRIKIKAGLNIPVNATVVSIFARLEEYKDHRTFLRAAYVLRKFKNIYFLIIGNGSLEIELKNYAKRLGIENQVLFLGFVDDITDLMNITDINVNCSIGTETSSLALSEGMSIGIPAIASDYTGNKYMIQDQVNGLIFSQKNYVELAKKILLLSNDKKLYYELSNNAYKRFCEELNAKRMTQETEKYYISLLKAGNSKIHFQ